MWAMERKYHDFEKNINILEYAFGEGGEGRGEGEGVNKKF